MALLANLFRSFFPTKEQAAEKDGQKQTKGTGSRVAHVGNQQLSPRTTTT